MVTNESRNESRLNGVKTCIYCGQEFVANHRVQKYCTSECRLEAHNFRLYRKKA